nr:hypothetical protein [Angustibacter aerolatus]
MHRASLARREPAPLGRRVSDFSHPDPAQRPAQPPNPYGTPPAGPPGPVHGAPQPPPYAYQPSFQPAPDARRGPGGVAVAGLVVGGLALLGVVVLGLVLLAWWGGGFDEGDDLVGTAPQVTQPGVPRLPGSPPRSRGCSSSRGTRSPAQPAR